MLKDAVGPCARECAVIEVEPVSVAGDEFDWKAKTFAPALRFLDHGLAGVDADRASDRRHESRHGLDVIAGAAADVEHMVARAKAKQCKRLPLVRAHTFLVLYRVEIIDERGGISGAVDDVPFCGGIVTHHSLPSAKGTNRF